MEERTIQERQRIEKILKWLPVIKQIISLGGHWYELKGICEPLGLTDTAFRENPKLSDFLVDEKYWRERLKQ